MLPKKSGPLGLRKKVMHTKAGVGMSHHRNPMMAGREAVETALKNGGIEKPDFVFMFATVGYDQQALLKAVREASGRAPLCGCSGEGTMIRGEVDESNFSLGGHGHPIGCAAFR